MINQPLACCALACGLLGFVFCFVFLNLHKRNVAADSGSHFILGDHTRLRTPPRERALVPAVPRWTGVFWVCMCACASSHIRWCTAFIVFACDMSVVPSVLLKDDALCWDTNATPVAPRHSELCHSSKPCCHGRTANATGIYSRGRVLAFQ